MSWLARLAAPLLAILLVLAVSPSFAQAESLGDDGGAEWRLEQPEAPEPPPGIERPDHLVGLGHVGDIEFEAPNRGALITAGNGSTISPGVWLYNGLHWRELSTVCGASDGRIAWAGPDEFWTVSDGRPGQAPNSQGVLPPLEDDTLCHFAVNPASERFEAIASYATLGFQSTSYQAMHGAACLSSTDCWFGGAPLPAPGVGSFQLHWNGSAVIAEPYTPEGHTVEEMRPFEGSIFQSLLLLSGDIRITHEPTIPPARQINGDGVTPIFQPLAPPLYGEAESPFWVQAAHLGGDAEALWGAAGPSPSAPEGLKEPGVAVVRYSKSQFVPVLGEYVAEETPSWTQVLGPNTTPTGRQLLGEETDVNAIAAEPGTHSAWLGLDSRGDEEFPSPTADGTVARITADGTVSDRLTLPETGGPIGPKGAVAHIACPAEHDCWLITRQGWIFHLSVAGESAGGPPDGAFAEIAGETPIDQRPADEGVPQTQPDSLPEDDSGEGGPPAGPSVAELLKQIPNPFATITLPLLSKVHSRLIHGSTLELSFHLAVKARVRLLAERRKKVVASTRRQTLTAGSHKLMLRLDIKRWPTKLDLQTHALAPLPTTNTRESNTGTVGTSELLPAGAAAGGWSRFP